jgi:hypothetical protein
MMIANEPPSSADERAADLVLARLHLRLGSLGLARAELEALAGRNGLDLDGIRDLAEARWRTGDLSGAGDAAVAYLEERPDDVLTLLITAEVQAHLGRPGEARRIAARVLERSTVPVETLFAGMPRSSVWPVDPGIPVGPAGTLFDDVPAAPSWLASGLPGPVLERGSDDRADEAGGSTAAAGGEPAEPDGPRLWDNDVTAAPTLPDPASLLARAREALDGDRPGQAAAGLALALRAEPSFAPAILDLLAGREEPVLALVRGDAHRIVGHEGEALRDYVAAVAAIGLERSSDRRGRSGTRAGQKASANPDGPEADATPAVTAPTEPPPDSKESS